MAAPTTAPAGENPYGLLAALQEGGLISWTVFIILVAMSVGTFYILFTKLLQQQKIMSQGNKVRASELPIQSCWSTGSVSLLCWSWAIRASSTIAR